MNCAFGERPYGDGALGQLHAAWVAIGLAYPTSATVWRNWTTEVTELIFSTVI